MDGFSCGVCWGLDSLPAALMVRLLPLRFGLSHPCALSEGLGDQQDWGWNDQVRMNVRGPMVTPGQWGTPTSVGTAGCARTDTSHTPKYSWLQSGKTTQTSPLPARNLGAKASSGSPLAQGNEPQEMLGCARSAALEEQALCAALSSCRISLSSVGNMQQS